MFDFAFFVPGTLETARGKIEIERWLLANLKCAMLDVWSSFFFCRALEQGLRALHTILWTKEKLPICWFLIPAGASATPDIINTSQTTICHFFSPAISPRHIFDKGVRKALVQSIYRSSNTREELKLEAMGWFPNRGPVEVFSWTRLIAMRFLFTGVVGSKFAQPLIQRKYSKS